MKTSAPFHQDSRFKVLVLAAVFLLTYGFLTHWPDIKAGFKDGYTAGYNSQAKHRP